MRIIGLLLVLFGGLTLGHDEFASALSRMRGGADAQAEHARGPGWYVPPVVGGIALVSGLLVLATTWRREEN